MLTLDAFVLQIVNFCGEGYDGCKFDACIGFGEPGFGSIGVIALDGVSVHVGQ